MKTNIFKYSSYREYLLQLFNSEEFGKGQRSALAKHLNCQTGFVSQVINGTRHFSLEHLLEVARFYGLNDDETDFFLLLGQFERAGSNELRNYYKDQLDKYRFSRQRLPVKEQREVTDYDFAMYNSQWYHIAIHVLLELKPQLSVEQMARTLNINVAKVNKTLNFLEDIGAVENKDGKLRPKEINNTIGRDSPYVDTVHRHLRFEAIKALDNRVPEDSHYSRFFLASKDRAAVLQEELYEFLRRFNKTIGEPYDNPNEKKSLFGFSTDCYQYNE